MPKGKPNTISLDDFKAFIETIRSEPKTQTLDVETKANLDQEFKSQHERWQAQTHYWVTFHKMGDDDNIPIVDVYPAGVPYICRKGERVLVPQAVLDALDLAVVNGTDFLSPPVIINEIKYRRKKVERRFNYTIEPTPVSPEEAAAWRLKIEKHAIETQGMVQVGSGGIAMEDLVEVGR